MAIYLDNAATTPMDPTVLETMTSAMSELFGNPSSPHATGRKAKAKIEEARKTIAKLIGCSSAEIYFTSGGSEADNVALLHGYFDNNCEGIVSSKLEHHAVLNTIKVLEEKHDIPVFWLDNNEKGELDLDALRQYLEANPKQLVSLMHVNNEIGNVNPINEIAAICEEHKALFHTDAVQSLGFVPVDLQETNVSFLAASAHKFHGPKGLGFLYVNKNVTLNNWQFGGGQEKGLRAGTENVPGILGMTKALSLAIETGTEDLIKLKSHLIEKVKAELPEAEFNGTSSDLETSSPKIVSLLLPEGTDMKMLLFQLDMDGISLSGGSACQSGAIGGSHVINELGIKEKRAVIRVSLSKFNTELDIDTFVEKLKARIA